MEHVLVSVIIPVHNAEPWLDEAFQSITKQTWKKSLEISVFDDASTDFSSEIIKRWKRHFEENEIQFILKENETASPGGVGYAKNHAIYQSNGEYLCFLDADDWMYPRRIELQLEEAKRNPSAIVGSQFERSPKDSTKRYTVWANTLSKSQLLTQVYTSFGPTVIQPTWFCHRSVYEKAGPFDEIVKGFPEDLTFFYRHINQGGKVLRVDETLLIYRYHLSAATFSVDEDTIWCLRVNILETNVLDKWSSFTIWNAGKQGRKLYRSLSPRNRAKVSCFCDVDEKKIQKGYYKYETAKRSEAKTVVPVVHFSEVTPPIIICMKLGLTDGVFEENLNSLQLLEGRDFYHFN